MEIRRRCSAVKAIKNVSDSIHPQERFLYFLVIIQVRVGASNLFRGEYFFIQNSVNVSIHRQPFYGLFNFCSLLVSSGTASNKSATKP
jgi:hypothetical protein